MVFLKKRVDISCKFRVKKHKLKEERGDLQMCFSWSGFGSLGGHKSFSDPTQGSFNIY
jgi:hypothetical protein